MLLLCVWQKRWGYFLALGVALSIPWQLGALRSRALGWVVGLLALWPAAHQNWTRWHPTEEQMELRAYNSIGHEYWRQIAQFMRSPERRPFLAPWWVSPEIAYWSRQPGVAGTSHQSLAGIVDTANFFLSDDVEEIAEILRRRQVRTVLIDDVQDPNNDDRLAVITNSEKILNTYLHSSKVPFGELLGSSPLKAPKFLHHVTPKERGLVIDLTTDPDDRDPQKRLKLYRRQFLHIYTVDPSKL
jgi:hypothetical protein